VLTRGRESGTSSSSSIPSPKRRSRPSLQSWRSSTPETEIDPKRIVRDGYDRISYEYRDDTGRGPSTEDRPERTPSTGYEAWLAELIPLLEERDPVLDLGCGCGVPATAILAERFAVTGVDISPVQIERARRLVPAAQFVCQDMSVGDFPPESFSAIVSFFAIIHVPVQEQPGIFQKLSHWLRPGGYLLATVGTRAWTGTEDDWHGAPMYWSQADQGTYLAWLNEVGFEVLWTRFIPEGDSGHTLLLAKRAPTLPTRRGAG
jgi:SAM-dependent methyltransferase